MIKTLTILLVGLAAVLWQPKPSHCTPKNKLTCIQTGNAYFFKVCNKRKTKCWLEYGIQYFMFNKSNKTRKFVFACTLRYGYGLGKQKATQETVILKPGINALGGAGFTWPRIKQDRARKRYKHKCTCTVKPLLSP